MRTFDYRHLPQSLFDGKVGDANVKLFEDKGKLDLIEQLHPEQLEPLRVAARADAADASTRVEGLYVQKSRVNALLGGASPRNEVEQQLVGYAHALDLIEAEADTLELAPATIVKLYETPYAHRNLGNKSRYRKKDYLYVQVDGHMQAMPVSPITAFETPLVLGGACDSLASAFDTKHGSMLILSAVFTVDFFCIRPFDEGNGRIARLFADLLLRKAGFNVSRYQCIESIIETDGMAYYDALNACVEGWDRGANDYAPYTRYWLDAVHRAYQRLFEKIDAGVGKPGNKTERIRSFVRDSSAPVSKRQIREAFPDISEATVENALGAMVRAGEAEKLGAGRSTAYQWK